MQMREDGFPRGIQYRYYPTQLHLLTLLIALCFLILIGESGAWAYAQDGSMMNMQMQPRQLQNKPSSQAGLSQTSEAESDILSARQMIMLNMQREGSGTGWQPLDNPMMMKMFMEGPWVTMLHGGTFLDNSVQGGPRGGNKIRSQNWLMLSTSRPIGNNNIIQLRGMFSAEPFTIGKAGYPLLFQTGETYHGVALIDYQHPHDLFMELSADYMHRILPHTWVNFYVAPVGEPALGPVVFHHRYSAFLDPEAPLGHHVQDSTHISFGVLTASIIYKNWQLEGSLFNGKEPDENRYNFDFGPLTSYSGRLSYLLGQHWSFQISHGHLEDPERNEPGDVDRTTASVQYDKTFHHGWWANTLVFGHNFKSGHDDNSVLLESTVNFREKNYLFGRIENIQKSGLLRNEPAAAFNISDFSVGLGRELFRIMGIPITLGAMVSVYAKPHSLESVYGSFPISFHVFLHTNVPRMRM